MSEKSLDDEAALINAAKANLHEFGELYKRYYPRVYTYALYRISNPQSADDITAQVFERAIRKINTYQSGSGSFAGWLFAIAHNTVNNHLRSSRLRRWVSLDILTNRTTETPSLEELACRNEQLHQLMILIGHLSHQERDILALKFGAGLTNRRIAELTGLTESNIGVIIYRTIGKLRNQFSTQERKHEQAKERG